MSNSAELERIIELSDGDIDFQNCAGYLILGHQISSMVKKVEIMTEDSREADKKIIETLDKINDKIDENKESGNKAALNNEKRLSTVEEKISSISVWVKMIVGLFVPALIAFVLKQLGIF